MAIRKENSAIAPKGRHALTRSATQVEALQLGQAAVRDMARFVAHWPMELEVDVSDRGD